MKKFGVNELRRMYLEFFESKEHLKSLLDGRSANGIIFTTMQKFEESFDCLSERRNIIVMADEAHRGQYGLTEKIKITKNMKIGQMRQMTTIIEDFLHDDTSKIRGIKKQKKKIIEGMQQALSEEKIPLTDADAELLFQMLSDRETFRQFSDKYGASEVWSIMQEAKNKHVDKEEDFERLLGQIAKYPDLETRASARKLFRKYLKKEED